MYFIIYNLIGNNFSNGNDRHLHSILFYYRIYSDFMISIFSSTNFVAKQTYLHLVSYWTPLNSEKQGCVARKSGGDFGQQSIMSNEIGQKESFTKKEEKQKI